MAGKFRVTLRVLVLVLLPFLALSLQSTVLSPYSIKGVVPDIVLVIVVCYAMLNSKGHSVAYGVFCGLLEDLFSARIIGINAIAKGVTAYIISRLQPRLFQDNALVGLLMVLIGTVLNLLLSFLILYFTAGVFHVHHNIIQYGLYQILYNSIMAIPVYYLFYLSKRDVQENMF